MSTDESCGPALKDRADELSDTLRLVRDALSLDLGDGVDVVDGARVCREERDHLRLAMQSLVRRLDANLVVADTVDQPIPRDIVRSIRDALEAALGAF